MVTVLVFGVCKIIISASWGKIVGLAQPPQKRR